jgi:hypothetical protein
MVGVLDEVTPWLLKVPQKDVRIIRATNQIILRQKSAAGNQSSMARKFTFFLNRLDSFISLLILQLLTSLVDMDLAMKVSTSYQVTIFIDGASVE